MTSTPLASERTKLPWLRWLVIAALLAITIFGAAQLAFLCDDAFIHFRYVANAHAGRGLVWNPAPFQPVEGMGFLWVMVLWGIWSCFGVAPPDAANPFSILCGVGQVVLLAIAALRLRRRDGSRLPDAVGLCALAVIVGNRTFLQWMTSGLDAALFNLAFLAWVLHAFRAPERRGRGWLALWSLAAAVAALTRPDGLLLVCATAAVGGVLVVQQQQRWRHVLWGLAPLLLVVAQVLWRRSYYGEWLPNTYYAKVVAAWPEAGLRYFACFAIENGAWLWGPVLLVWLGSEWRRFQRATWRVLWLAAPALAAIGATVFHASYYVLKVGGDHFEYRVLCELVPLGVLACAAMAARISNGPRLPIVTVLCLGLASSASWLHLAWTRDMPMHGWRPITQQAPAFARPLVRWFDRQQAWLVFRNIGLRCNHHAIILRAFMEHFPHIVRVADSPDAFPMFATGAVGIPSWSLPDCAILDLHGLNDWVVARTPVRGFGEPLSSERFRPFLLAADVDKDGWLDFQELRACIGRIGGGDPTGEGGDYLPSVFLAIYAHERDDALTLDEAIGIGDSLANVRSMAHERHPPEGYVEAFEPNVGVHHGVASVTARKVPLTAERVRAIEAEWRAKVERERAGR